jgi:hypothetical protein
MSKAEKTIGLLTLLFAAMGTLAAWIVVPEFRHWTGLEKPSETKTKPASPPLAAQSLSSGAPNDSHLPGDELPGTWADTGLNWFYQFQAEGKVILRFRRFDAPSPVSSNMTWYRVGQTIHFSDTGFPSKCIGTLNGNKIHGNCELRATTISWNLQRIDNQPPPRKTPIIVMQKPLPTDGVWLEDSLRAEGKPVFFEFVPNGKVRMRFGLDGSPIISKNTWYQIGETVHLTEFVKNETIECQGKIENEVIEGTRQYLQGTQLAAPSPWKLQRVRR